MITVKTLAEAYAAFTPYNPRRPAETVVICSGGVVTFLHWDPFPAEFTVENGAERQAFLGWHIDRMAEEAQPDVENVVPIRLASALSPRG